MRQKIRNVRALLAWLATIIGLSAMAVFFAISFNHNSIHQPSGWALGWALGGCSLFLAGVIGLVLQWKHAFLESLDGLAKTADQIRIAGNLGLRLPDCGKRELAPFIRSFNSLLEQIENQPHPKPQPAPFLANLSTHAPCALIACDPQGILLSLNPAAERLTGYSASELVGKESLTRIYEPGEWSLRLSELRPSEAAVPSLAAQALHHLGTEQEWTLLRKDGTRKPVLIAAQDIRNEADQLVGFALITRLFTGPGQAERALQRSEARVASILRAAPVGIGLLVNRVHQEINDALCTITGYPPEELVGHTTRHLYDSEADFVAVGTLYQSIRDNNIGRAEVRWRRKDGTLRDILVAGAAMVPGDLAQGVTFVALDITERKQAERALQQSEARLASLLRAAPVGIGVFINRILVEANDAVCAITGYPREELIGHTSRQLFLSDAEYEAVGKLYERIARGETCRWENCWRRKDGALCTVLLHATSLGGHDLSQGVAFMLLDITERKFTEDALRKSELFLSRSQVAGRIGAFILEVTGAQTWTSTPVMDEIFGIDASYPKTGEGWLALIVEREEIRLYFQRQVFEVRGRFEKQYRIVRPRDGQMRWIDGSGDVELDAQGAPLRLIGTVQDITERKRLEAQLLQGQKMQAIGTLAGGIAHDFNNILTAIMGNAELALLSIPADHEVHPQLEAIYQATERARDLVMQILSFSRLQEHQLQPIVFWPVVTEALKLLRATLPTTIDIRAEPGATCPPIMGDTSQIHQVIMNLGTNAAHAIRENGGIIEITQTQGLVDDVLAQTCPQLHRGRYLRLTVRDTGSGMSPEVLERIFEPFFTTKQPGRGTGLGLAVVHGIMQRHQGAITVESEPGKGTSFHLYFPASETIPLTPTPPTPPPRLGTGQHILLVDDEPSVVDIGQRLLTRAGYKVTASKEAKEALALFQANPQAYDLVITDLTMPHMTGVHLSSALHALRSDIPVILSTGFAENLNLDDLPSKGVRTLLLKPFTMDTLQQALHQALLKLPPQNTASPKPASMA